MACSLNHSPSLNLSLLFADYPSFHLTLCKISLLTCWSSSIYFTNGMCSGPFFKGHDWKHGDHNLTSTKLRIPSLTQQDFFANYTHFLIITKCCYLIPRYRECQHLPPILEACSHLPLLSFPTNLPRVTIKSYRIIKTFS